MSFLHAPLLWGLLAVGLPVLIHLINMMRHRRVHWAAMEFLLASQKKNRTWILLKQLLLLLLRMGAVAAVALMVAQPQVSNRLGQFFGGGKTHHIVLLDDSFSMSEQRGSGSPFADAKRKIAGLVQAARSQPAPPEITLLRFSRASQAGRAAQYDLLNKRIDSAEFEAEFEQLLQGLDVSELSPDPGPALDTAIKLVEEQKDAASLVYLLSDYRLKEWNEAGDLRKRLLELNRLGVEPKLIACVDSPNANLAITSLRPMPGTRAAGVNLVMEVGVQNFGSDKARNVTVMLYEDGQRRTDELIEEIAPGQVQTRTFEVRFSKGGQHEITARLAGDTVAADNARYSVLEFAAAAPVLIVEGNPSALGTRESDSYFLATALSPDIGLTGLKPQIETAAFLRNKPLAGFHAIYLANVETLQQSEARALEEYAAGGGGVAFFMGDRVKPDDYNRRLYRNGEGIFPVPLVASVLLPVDRAAKSPDLDVSNHPVFGKFAGDRNPFIAAVNVERYMAAQKNWTPPPGSTAKVIARLRNGAPLAVESRFGKGRVVAFLTTAAPTWNNWGKANPSYTVALQQLQAYLSLWKQDDPARQVGVPLVAEYPAAEFQPDVDIAFPSHLNRDFVTIKAQPAADRLTLSFAETDRSGVYTARLRSGDQQTQDVKYAYNVAAKEGDLSLIDRQRLADSLSGVTYEFFRASDAGLGVRDLAGSNLSTTILYLLVALLIGEQLLAYSASYHASPREKAS